MAVMTVYEFLEYRSASARLHTIADSILENRALSPAATVALLQDAIKLRLKPWPPGEFEKRPFLRDSAETIWRIHLGKCGDGSRLLIQLLSTLRIAARRVLMYDKTGEAVNAGIEYNDAGQWVYEAAFNNAPREVEYTRANPAGIRDHMQGDNPVSRHYVRFGYLHDERMGLRFRITRPLPGWLGFLLETPSLIWMSIWSLGSFVCLTLWYGMQRREVTSS